MAFVEDSPSGHMFLGRRQKSFVYTIYENKLTGMTLGLMARQEVSRETKETMMSISPVSAAVAGALISGVAMYAVGPRADRVDAFAQQPTAYVETVDGRIIPVTPAAQAAGYVSSLQPTANLVPAVQRTVVTPTPRRTTAYRAAAAPAQERVVVERSDGRSWKKTAMVIGGTTAAGAGVGGIVGGKKGALIGAALGGGAASIYEAGKR